MKDEQGAAAALRESERHGSELLARLQQSVETAESLRTSNEQLQAELKRLADNSQKELSESSRLRDKALQASQKYVI